MDNSLILILTFLIPIIIITLISLRIRNSKIDSKDRFNNYSKNLQKAIDMQDLEGVKKYGVEIIYNDCMTLAKLNDISDKVSKLNDPDGKLNDLKSRILSKKVDWTRTEYPMSQ